jgi:ribosomal protein S13
LSQNASEILNTREKTTIEASKNLQELNAEEVEKLNEEIANYNGSLKITNKKKAEYNELFKWQQSQKIRKFMLKTEISNTKGTAPFAFLMVLLLWF